MHIIIEEVLVMNETIRNILERRSIRAYTSEPVKYEDLELIIQCGLYAASGMGRQPWHFTVLKDRALMDRISAVNREFLLNSSVEEAQKLAASPDFDTWRGATCAIIVSGDDSEFAAYDCSNAAQNMSVAAKSLGLGTRYMVSFKVDMNNPEHQELMKALEIPDGYIPLVALSLGHPAETPVHIPRKTHCVNYV